MALFATNTTNPQQAVTVGTVTIQPGETKDVSGTSPNVLQGLELTGKIRTFGTTPADAFAGNNARSYSCQASYASLVSLNGDIFSIAGAAGSLVFVSKIIVSGAAALTAVNADISLVRRSTPNTGGTPTLLVPAQHDTRDTAPAAKCWSYATNPAVGTQVGTPFRRNTLALLPAGSMQQPFPWVFGDDAKAVVLNGANESLCVSLNGISVGASISVAVEFFELGIS